MNLETWQRSTPGMQGLDVLREFKPGLTVGSVLRFSSRIAIGRAPEMKADPTKPRMRRLLRTKEAATYLGTSAWSIQQLALNGKLPYVQLVEGSGPYLFDVRDLDGLIERLKTVRA